MFPGGPAIEQIVNNNLTATGALYTVPAGHTLTADVQLSAAVAVAGTMTASISVLGTGGAPANNGVVARLVVSGLLASAAADSNSAEILVKAPPGNSLTLQFTATGAGAASCVINGWIFT